MTVQNRYNLADRQSEPVLDYCTREQIGFIPWAPLAAGSLAESSKAVERVATQLGATASQVALAWLLRKSPVILPIPGTASVTHLEANARAAVLELDDDAFEALDSESIGPSPLAR